MHAQFRHALSRLTHTKCTPHLLLRRNVSLQRAIGDGIRKTASALKTTEERRFKDSRISVKEGRSEEKLNLTQSSLRRRHGPSEEEPARKTFGVTPDRETIGRSRGNRLNGTRTRRLRRVPSDVDDQAPLALPYSTAATEFIYGTFAVLAALKANRRKFYRLFIWSGDDASPIDADQQAIIKAANTHRVPIKKVAGNWNKVLDKLAGKRPHNGFILEASRLPMIPTQALARLENLHDNLEVRHVSIDKETKAVMKVYFSADDTCTFSRSEVRRGRYPLLLFLDRITDPGNMGAIFRTAYFLGVEAVIVPEHGTAPLSPVTVKASAGALEHIPIFSVKNEVQFMRYSQQQGWAFLAAGANESPSNPKSTHTDTEDSQGLVNPYALLRERPCVLMLGNEGTGLRSNLQQLADFSISVPRSRRRNDDIDSLNVSVAAGLLMDRFLLRNEDVFVRKNHVWDDDKAAKQVESSEVEPAAPLHSVENTIF